MQLKNNRKEHQNSQNIIPSKHKTFCITFVQRRPNVFDVGPTMYKCYIIQMFCAYWVCATYLIDTYNTLAARRQKTYTEYTMRFCFVTCRTSRPSRPTVVCASVIGANCHKTVFILNAMRPIIGGIKGGGVISTKVAWMFSVGSLDNSLFGNYMELWAAKREIIILVQTSHE